MNKTATDTRTLAEAVTRYGSFLDVQTYVNVAQAMAEHARAEAWDCLARTVRHAAALQEAREVARALKRARYQTRMRQTLAQIARERAHENRI